MRRRERPGPPPLFISTIPRPVSEEHPPDSNPPFNYEHGIFAVTILVHMQIRTWRCARVLRYQVPAKRRRQTRRNLLPILGLLCIGSMAGHLSAQSPSASQLVPLCELQTKVAQGEHRAVRVEGVYLTGLEGQYLVTPGCSGRSTDIEFELKSHRFWKRLVQMSNKTNTRKHLSGDGDAVLVVFEGEFYGPYVPDPKLPEAIRKNYHPAWDHNNASMTKLVVHVIQSVEALPADHPCAPPKSDPSQWPCFQNPGPVSQPKGAEHLGGWNILYATLRMPGPYCFFSTASPI